MNPELNPTVEPASAALEPRQQLALIHISINGQSKIPTLQKLDMARHKAGRVLETVEAVETEAAGSYAKLAREVRQQLDYDSWTLNQPQAMQVGAILDVKSLKGLQNLQQISAKDQAGKIPLPTYDPFSLMYTNISPTSSSKNPLEELQQRHRDRMLLSEAIRARQSAVAEKDDDVLVQLDQFAEQLEQSERSEPGLLTKVLGRTASRFSRSAGNNEAAPADQASSHRTFGTVAVAAWSTLKVGVVKRLSRTPEQISMQAEPRDLTEQTGQGNVAETKPLGLIQRIEGIPILLGAHAMVGITKIREHYNDAEKGRARKKRAAIFAGGVALVGLYAATRGISLPSSHTHELLTDNLPQGIDTPTTASVDGLPTNDGFLTEPADRLSDIPGQSELRNGQNTSTSGQGVYEYIPKTSERAADVIGAPAIQAPNISTETLHKVVAGDRIWDIARDHLQEQGIKHPSNAQIDHFSDAIRRANDLTEAAARSIKPGAQLKIP
ncbi:MAG TPA: LysM domain-containing protein [Candidatus Saccharimonadales bacterium]|jgi:hypothetical protein